MENEDYPEFGSYVEKLFYFRREVIEAYELGDLSRAKEYSEKIADAVYEKAKERGQELLDLIKKAEEFSGPIKTSLQRSIAKKRVGFNRLREQYNTLREFLNEFN